MEEHKPCIYNKHNIKGRGSYGVTYQADFNTVIKIPSDGYDPDRFENSDFPELDSIFRIRSPFIVKGLDIYDRGECGLGTDISYKMEMCEGPMKTLYSPMKPQSYSIRKEFALTAALGIRCFHRNRFLHLDLADTNIMYNRNEDGTFVAKIIDTGLGNYVERDENGNLEPLLTHRERCTIYYKAPELLQSANNYIIDKDNIYYPTTKYQPRPVPGYNNYVCTDKCDVWSLGLNIFNLLACSDVVGKLFVISKLTNAMLQKLHNTHLSHVNIFITLYQYLAPQVPAEEIKLAVDLLSKMLTFDPTQRYDIEQVIDHQFFSTPTSVPLPSSHPKLPSAPLPPSHPKLPSAPLPPIPLPPSRHLSHGKLPSAPLPPVPLPPSRPLSQGKLPSAPLPPSPRFQHKLPSAPLPPVPLPPFSLKFPDLLPEVEGGGEVKVAFKRIVQNKFENLCSTKESTHVKSATKFTPAKEEGLKHVFWLFNEYYSSASKVELIPFDKTNYVEARLSHFCLALDLYMRFISATGDEIVAVETRSVAYLACKMAYELYQSDNDSYAATISKVLHKSKLKQLLEERYAVMYKGKFLKLIKGRIFYDTFFHLCNSVEEIILVINEIFCSQRYEVLEQYLLIDFPTYILSLRLKNKFSTIKEYTNVPFVTIAKSFITKDFEIERIQSQSGLKLINPRTKGLNYIVQTLSKEYSDLPAYIFFCAIEVYLTYISSIKLEIIEEVKNSISIAESTVIFTILGLIRDVKALKGLEYEQYRKAPALISKYYSYFCNNRESIDILKSKGFYSVAADKGKLLLFYQKYLYSMNGEGEEDEASVESFSGWDLKALFETDKFKAAATGPIKDDMKIKDFF
jgi:serine/threonine protein kinase